MTAKLGAETGLPFCSAHAKACRVSASRSGANPTSLRFLIESASRHDHLELRRSCRYFYVVMVLLLQVQILLMGKKRQSAKTRPMCDLDACKVRRALLVTSTSSSLRMGQSGS